MKYRKDRGSHAIYKIQFCYVCCVNNGEEVLNKEIKDRLKEINLSIADKFGIHIIVQVIARDYILIRFESKPQIQVSKFINSLKSVSSRYLKKEFSEIQNKFKSKPFWSKSYLLVSTGDIGKKDIDEYRLSLKGVK